MKPAPRLPAPFAYDGPPELLEPVARALRRVVDPEVAMDILDVGLVYGVRVRGRDLEVDVTMTSPACPVADVIVTDIENELDRELPPDMRIRVGLVWEPPWTSDRMSDSAKAFMGW